MKLRIDIEESSTRISRVHAWYCVRSSLCVQQDLNNVYPRNVLLDGGVHGKDSFLFLQLNGFSSFGCPRPTVHMLFDFLLRVMELSSMQKRVLAHVNVQKGYMVKLPLRQFVGW